jgi:hypothetical protein
LNLTTPQTFLDWREPRTAGRLHGSGRARVRGNQRKAGRRRAARESSDAAGHSGLFPRPTDGSSAGTRVFD